MKHKHLSQTLFGLLLLFPTLAWAQGTLADYERANALRNKLQGLAVNVPERANWIGNSNRFWYRKAVKGGFEFVLFDAATLAKQAAFDHEKLARALVAVLPPGGEEITALRLPFIDLTFVDSERAIEVNA